MQFCDSVIERLFRCKVSEMEIIKHLVYPDELYALIKYKMCGYQSNVLNKESLSPTKKCCYELLNKTSRSFAAVIQELDDNLRDGVCIFYLVLRALDTVEDDMTIPEEKKVPMLKSFYKNLYDPNWCFMESTEKDKAVLEEFPVISAEFRSLPACYQDVILDICQRMGEGMTVYLYTSPLTMSDWDEYCHYVAGLVGIGLSRLFSASHLEDKIVGYDTRLANSMGLFLQKTNIIRDILEDVQQGRYFWPKEAWGKYVDDLADITDAKNHKGALHCLNELITNALQHIPDVIKYLSRIKNPSVFRFCAVPQVMAIATLERCYNNRKVFEGVVKIRKGEAVKMILGTSSLEATKAVFKHFCNRIYQRIPADDPSSVRTRSLIAHSLDLTKTEEEFVSSAAYLPLYVSFSMMIAAILWQYYHGIYSISEQFNDSAD